MSFHFIHSLPNSAFLFPGQGSQHVGMAKLLVEAYPIAQKTFQEADDLLGFGLSHLCFEGPEDELTDTINAQPALLATSVALLRVLEQEFGARPQAEGSHFVAGHSMGEYSALVAAGALSFPDGLQLVRTRGRLMKEAGTRTPGMMAAVLGLDEPQIAALCAQAVQGGGVAQVANDNCPGQIVISGDKEGMAKAIDALSKAGAKKVVPLAVSIAAHSPLMQSAAQELSAAIAATALNAPTAPVIGNTSARPLTTAEELRHELNAQLTGSVRWTASMQFLVGAGVTRIVEIGPGEVLSGLMKRIERGVERMAVNDPEGVKGMGSLFIA